MATYHSDGSINGIPNGINTLIAGAIAGDTITIPDAPFTLGAGGAFINITKAITLMGLGPNCVITISSGTHASGLIQVYAAATIRDLKIVPVAGKYLFGILANGWTITNIIYNQAFLPVQGRFAHISAGFGRIYLNDITCGHGQEETIFGQGPDDAWDTPYIPGTANSVIIERNIFRYPSGSGSQGYVCDANSNAMFTLRMNRIVNNQKIDGHGYNTNQSPARGVRGMEVFGNLWQGSGGSNWLATEIRGGCSYQFWNNVTSSSVILGQYRIDDYGANAPGSVNFSGIFQTPEDYPLPDQVGNGPGDIGSQAPGGQPSYFVNNYKGGAAGALRFDAIDTYTRSTNTTGYAIGESVITFVSGSNALAAGNYIKFPADPRFYLITVGRSTSAGPITISPPLEVAIPASTTAGSIGPIINYRAQTGNPSATFTMGPTAPCLIEANRDFFATVAGFTGAAGCGTGTDTAMGLITPSADGVGFWVNNEGTWNESFVGTIDVEDIEEWYWCEITFVGDTNFTLIGAPANTVGVCFLATGPGTGTGQVKPAQGQFYVGNSGVWELDYTPYTYPVTGDPPPPTPPTVSSATINAAGTTLTLGLSEACENGAGGGNGLTLSATGGAVTASYASGSGTSSYVYNLSRPIQAGEVVTRTYVQPGDGIKSVANAIELASFSNQPVTNGSTASGAQSSGLRSIASLGGGF